jgi:hypothetical protein
MRLVRAATDREHTRLAEDLSWRTGDNLLKLPAQALMGGAAKASAMAMLERARKTSMERVEKMPNFVADEIAHRYRSESTTQTWRLFDTLEAEITAKDGGLSRQNLRLNGAPTKKTLDRLDGPLWMGGFFGVELRMFDPNCAAKFDFAGVESIGGRQLQAYRFRSPPAGCLTARAGKDKYSPGGAGRVLVDERGEVLRYECEASGFPEKSPFDRVIETESWDYVTIGGSSRLVPVAASMSLFQTDGTAWAVRIEYRNHRHFEASAAVTYGPGK